MPRAPEVLPMPQRVPTPKAYCGLAAGTFRRVAVWPAYAKGSHPLGCCSGSTRTSVVGPTTPGTTPTTTPGRGVSDVTSNSNKRSNAGMDAIDFPDDLVQTQAAWRRLLRPVVWAGGALAGTAPMGAAAVPACGRSPPRRCAYACIVTVVRSAHAEIASLDVSR